jgi:putative Holliday junction resolvase
MAGFLGLDYGKRRIGIATGDDDRYLAFALDTHVEGRDGSVFNHLRKIIEDRDIRTIVLGLPLTADGQDGEMARAVRGFALLLEERLGLPVVLWDERFSSAEADRWLVAKKQVAKEDRDALAAEIILQSYLDHLRAEAERPGPGKGGD